MSAITRFFTWPLGIRQPTSRISRVVLAGSFCLCVFVGWIACTDNPRWLNRLIVMAKPEYELKLGDPVSIEIADGALVVTKVATGRSMTLPLPEIAASALPEFTEANYEGLFKQLADDGLTGFSRVSDTVFHAEVAPDASRAQARLSAIGPLRYELPLEAGEKVKVLVNFQRRQATVFVDRVNRRVILRLGKVPAVGERFPPNPADYQYLVPGALRYGVTGLAQHPKLKASSIDKSTATVFRGEVTDLEKAAGKLGPEHPVAPLTAGEAITITLIREQGVLKIARDKGGRREQTITVTPSLLAISAVPPLTAESYPGLVPLALSNGVSVTTTPAGELQAVIGDVDVARTEGGLGMEQRNEQRFLSGLVLPSPTEVVESVPSLLSRNLVLGKPPEDFATDTSLSGGFARWFCELLRGQGWLQTWVGWEDAKPIPQARTFSIWTGGIWLTTERILIGFGWSLVAFVLGLVMGAFGRIGVFMEPLKLTGMYLPLPALIPLTIVWAGSGESQVTMFLSLCMGAVLLPYTVSAVNAVPQLYLDTARSLGASRGQQVRFVLLAVSWSTILKGFRLSFAVGWTWMMLAELNGASGGLGYLINQSQRRAITSHVYLIIVIVIALAFVCNTLWNGLIWLLFPHERTKR